MIEIIIYEILLFDTCMLGEFYDQGDAKWIVIRGQLRGRNETPCGRPTSGRPIGRPGVGRPYLVISVTID
jgi:hypothetical protein